MKRSYKHFNIEGFLTDVLNSNINEKIPAINNLEEAAEEFESCFKGIIDKHAPIKTFQMYKHYLPYLSEQTKALIKERKEMKELSVKYGCNETERKAKKIGKDIKKLSTKIKDHTMKTVSTKRLTQLKLGILLTNCLDRVKT